MGFALFAKRVVEGEHSVGKPVSISSLVKRFSLMLTPFHFETLAVILGNTGL